MTSFTKTDTIRTMYNHELKTYTDYIVSGYQFSALMQDGKSLLTLHVRKSESGKTWEVVDANTSMLICSMHGTRQSAADEATRRVSTLTNELYQENVKRFQKYVKDYTEVPAENE